MSYLGHAAAAQPARSVSRDGTTDGEDYVSETEAESPGADDGAYFGGGAGVEHEATAAARAPGGGRGGHTSRRRKRKRDGGGRGAALPSLPFASVVKVFVKTAPWTYTAPWRKDSQKASMGSGFIVGGNRLLITNAHVVHRATSVIVQPQAGGPAKYAARVLCIGREIDLAILTVDEESFWVDKKSLEVRPYTIPNPERSPHYNRVYAHRPPQVRRDNRFSFTFHGPN